ncbi:MAG TPA: endonuclease/exonuclease/phosphatase family protein [Xanthomonadales bacterium]|nr:endonuclease/exonuclease/phosphatase family protein [Xanthomonadales bacterium]
MTPQDRDERERTRFRVATFNTSLYSDEDGGLIRRLEGGDAAARRIAAVLQTVRPDVVLLNEFDYDEAGRAADLFQRDYLGVGQDGRAALAYAHRYFAPVNTGVPSGLDIDGDGRTDGPGDAWGYGHHPGQYGMLVLSRFPIDAARVRSFRLFPWSAMPGALRPVNPDGSAFYPDATWTQLRLSSKSHWDVPIATPRGTLHFLVSHPTPPVFDGPDDHNGRRNHDEIRLWADYLSGATYLFDDAGARGGLAHGAHFVIAGDLNADPNDGASYDRAIRQLLDHARVRARPVPESAGAAEAGVAHTTHRTEARHDTAKFGGDTGNLRIDYVLPSTTLTVHDARVFWPVASHPDAALLEVSDHHLVWLDVSM